MVTAIIGVGNIGKAVAADLVRGGEPVVLAGRDRDQAEEVAASLGDLAKAAETVDAVAAADTVLFAVWLDATKELVGQLGARLQGKVVIDPSNPVAPDAAGQLGRTLPDDVSAASVVAGLLPEGAVLVKAFGTLGADSLANASGRTPDRAVLFYATDDAAGEEAVRRLITAAGFDPVKVGGLEAATRIEMFGDLHQFGGLDGRLVDAAEADAAVAAEPQG